MGSAGEAASTILHSATPPPLPSDGTSYSTRTPAQRAATAYAPASRCASAGWPRTPSQLQVERGRTPSHNEVFGHPAPQHATRGGRPGLATPRHLESKVGDIIFAGGAWGAGETTTRGHVHGVGGARWHEVGHPQTPVGIQTSHRAASRTGGRGEEAPRRQQQQPQMAFGAPPPERPTVGNRAHLSRAYMHNASTADRVIWGHDA